MSIFCDENYEGEVFSLNKNRFLGPFCMLQNKVKIYEVVKVKGKLTGEGETVRYWDPTDMSMSDLCLLVPN